jgi:hypothetical protein
MCGMCSIGRTSVAGGLATVAIVAAFVVCRVTSLYIYIAVCRLLWSSHHIAHTYMPLCTARCKFSKELHNELFIMLLTASLATTMVCVCASLAGVFGLKDNEAETHLFHSDLFI